jgi:hypothetical protein
VVTIFKVEIGTRETRKLVHPMAQPNASQRAPHFPPDEQGNITIPASLVGTGKEGELPPGDIQVQYTDTGTVQLYGNLRGPRGRRHPYNLHLELAVRLLATELEKLLKKVKGLEQKLEKAGDTAQLTKELEESRAARQTLDEQLEVIRKAHREELNNLREQFTRLQTEKAGDTAQRRELENLLQLLIALFEDEHTVFNIGKMTGITHPLYLIDLGTIVLYYTASEGFESLTVGSKEGVSHPIHPQHIELYGSQPNESGLTYIAMLEMVVEDPAYADATAKWTKERIKRLFVDEGPKPDPTEDALEVFVLPGLERIIPALGKLATSFVVEDPDASGDTEEPASANSSSPTEPSTEDPTANWKR